jgi:hypothetical protein
LLECSFDCIKHGLTRFQSQFLPQYCTHPLLLLCRYTNWWSCFKKDLVTINSYHL